MNKETYIRAILESIFSGYKDELIDIAVKRIMEYKEPAADVVEVVRCKNCAHHADLQDKDSSKWCEKIWCPKLCELVDEDFYCGMGDERDAEHE